MNLSFSSEVKYVALSEVMTLGMPTKEKTCNKHSHTAFALTDLSVIVDVQKSYFSGVMFAVG